MYGTKYPCSQCSRPQGVEFYFIFCEYPVTKQCQVCLNCLGCVAPISPWGWSLGRAELRDRGAGEGTQHAPQCSAVLCLALAVLCIPSTLRWPGKGAGAETPGKGVGWSHTGRKGVQAWQRARGAWWQLDFHSVGSQCQHSNALNH